MAKYLVLIYGDEQVWEAWSPEEEEANGRAHGAFRAAAGAAVIGGEELHGSSTATSLRPDAEGQPIATDGPFAETKEALGGYYVLDVPDLDAAVALAAKLPEAKSSTSGVEVRPIVDES